MRSRNNLIIFALVFFGFIISFRTALGFIADNIIVFTATVTESGFVDSSSFELVSFDWEGVDFSFLNPTSWDFDQWRHTTNGKLHDLVDIIAPALVNLMRVVLTQKLNPTVSLLANQAYDPRSLPNPFFWNV